jgi:hypothetical protein
MFALSSQDDWRVVMSKLVLLCCRVRLSPVRLRVERCQWARH